MSSIRSYSRRAGSLFAVAALVLATITPGLVPSFASAAQLTERSVKLSSSSKEMPGVSYEVTFTSDGTSGTAGSIIVDFCGNSPLLNATCDTPTGFLATGVGSSGDFTATSVDANTVRVVGDVEEDVATTFTLTGITNPLTVGPMYVRIVTYDGTNSTNYTNATTLGAGVVDTGSAAVNITDTIGVSGAVLESMTFCVAGGTAAIADNCNNGGALTAPTLKLGEEVSTGVFALQPTAVSTGDIYTQISTNAANGAIINLKSNATGCGGLLRAGDTTGACDIKPALSAGIGNGDALFGVTATQLAGGVGDDLITLGTYNPTTYALNYVDAQNGVTSTYGDPFLSTDGNQVSNKNTRVTFGASVAPNTPAGLYSADLSLIATGKF